MSYWILKENCYIISRTNVQRIKNMESEISENQLIFSQFDEEINRRIKDDEFPVDGDLRDPVKWTDMLEDDEDFREEFN